MECSRKGFYLEAGASRTDRTKHIHHNSRKVTPVSPEMQLINLSEGAGLVRAVCAGHSTRPGAGLTPDLVPPDTGLRTVGAVPGAGHIMSVAAVQVASHRGARPLFAEEQL